MSPRQTEDGPHVTAAALAAMVAEIECRLGPVPDEYRRALMAVDRARFVRPEDVDRAYRDTPLALDTPYGDYVATISAPHMYVLQFEAVGLEAGDSFLELGTGSGYGAALAAAVVGPAGRVTSVEVDPHLVALARAIDGDLPNLTLVHDDGLGRADLAATHQKIALTFATDEPPYALIAAMRPSSVLVAPVGAYAEAQRLLRWRRNEGGHELDDLGPVRFVTARPRIE
jgi:protein-L-isoaspartate(D-aspartate) O-methyltransferase